MDDGEIRISSDEREQALAALAEHHAAGRLDANEYEDRRGRANDAVVRRDITSLFVDLPEPRPTLGQPGASSLGSPVGSTTGAPAPPAPQTPPAAPSSPRAKLARTLVSLSPFIALGTFFLTRSWLAFLLIPIIAILARTFDD